MRSRFIAGIGAIGLAAGTATIAHAVANDTVYDTLSYTVNELDYDVTDLFSEQEIPIRAMETASTNPSFGKSILSTRYRPRGPTTPRHCLSRT